MSQAVVGERVSSFSKALALGEIHEDVVFPYPIPRGEEADRVRALIEGFRAYAAEHIDSHEIDRTGARVGSALDGLERNDDDRMHSIATLAYKRGAYGYALFED